MRTVARIALCLSLAGVASPQGADRIRVVATIPDLADLVAQIGGDRVEVTSIAKGTMNVHAVPLKPSTLVAVNRADLFVQIGLSLEHAYVPGLLMKARNPRIDPGAPGFVNCSEGWEPIDVPAEISRRQAADVHPMGNPHFNLDPRGGPHMAERILAGLLRVDPQGADAYRERHAAWTKRYQAASERWKEIGERLRGKKVVTYHNDLDYFLRCYDMRLVATIEPKPGVPPTPGDLADVVGRIRAEGVRAVLTAKWSNTKSVRFVTENTEAEIVELPVLVGGVPGADSWIEMMDLLHARLDEALGGT